MFNAFLRTFWKQNVLNFYVQKGKISFQFPHSESSLHSEFLLCLWYQKGIWSHRKTFWKIIQNEKCWTFQKLSDQKRSEFWAVAWKRYEFFRTFFRMSVKVHWTFTSIWSGDRKNCVQRNRKWGGKRDRKVFSSVFYTEAKKRYIKQSFYGNIAGRYPKFSS